MRQCLQTHFEKIKKHYINKTFIINNNTVRYWWCWLSSVSLISKSDVGLSKTPSQAEQSRVGSSVLVSPPSPTKEPSQEGVSALHTQAMRSYEISTCIIITFNGTSPGVKTRYGSQQGRRETVLVLLLKPFQVLLRRICISVTMW